ncbi:SusD/RagB family nutrient-binding outer membrane lipoprotein [Olivibacter sp. SDN3]|uniref:SusD/RagB family nutrient-binding outer membrane lipoprotein n=1 Tax=Olivibacter sp. SDN3 TaxID=2764720 RepID=UPI001650DFE7|nr:SusD/RagB family nutrient-binding outer membrane lipoprotein [Olivibacter sp. SDN3]QNL49355.1 SusD/RagB family nutrient-binding outer membrane lipoprotein [Olivibacter sp. SDN3]
MKKIKQLFMGTLMVILSLNFPGCTGDFEEMNVSPNDPNAVSPQLLLPFAIESAVDRYWGHQTRFARLNLDGGSIWVQHLARRIYTTEGDTYAPPTTLQQENWQYFFNDGLLNFEAIHKQAILEGNTNYQGVALVMKSWVFSILTDVWGDIPYHEALKGTAEDPIYTPTYNTQEDIYADLLNQLAGANELLDVNGPAIAGDILFNGDILRWKKFANSLRLKLANRQAAKKPAESSAIMVEILANPDTYPVFTDNTDYAFLLHSANRPSNNEWHEVMIQGSRTDWRLSRTLVNRLLELDDPRLQVYGRPLANGSYRGMANGLPDAIAIAEGDLSSFPGDYFTRAEAPSVIMSYAELNFVLAEAAFDGDIDGGTALAQMYFERGVEASFDQYGLDMPANYISSLGTLNKALIMEQKWIALFGQGIEAWTEYRRTGLPAIMYVDPRAAFENQGVLPTRIVYPASEYSLNGSNVVNGTSPDNMRTKLWWAE